MAFEGWGIYGAFKGPNHPVRYAISMQSHRHDKIVRRSGGYGFGDFG